MSSDTETSALISLEATIRKSIPLSVAMQFSIEALSLDAIRTRAPLEPNVNIHGTGFAGSIYSLAVLTGWALCTHIIDSLGFEAELVVGSADIRYRAPVTGALDCCCQCSSAQRDAFRQALEKPGRGKLTLEVDVGNIPQARLLATFYASLR